MHRRKGYGPLKILLVDDDRDDLDLLGATLKKCGHEVLTASNGSEAWEISRRSDCRLVITDWNMPGMDGAELVRRIRSDGGAPYTYLILITGHADQAALREGMEAGADDFLGKPVNAVELTARLRVAERILRLQEDLLERNRKDQEHLGHMQKMLQSAARVQRSLLPSKAPSLKSVSASWRSEPCEELGGDIFNLFQADEHHLALYVLDVSGHGVPAALLAVQVSRLMTPLLSAGSVLKARLEGPPGYRLLSPLEVLEELNRAFPIQGTSSQFFTMLYGLLDLRTHRLDLASAGHPGPTLIRTSGEAETIGVSSHPIGWFASGQAQFMACSLSLEPGDRIYLYSDGVTECEDARGQIFGADQLRETLRLGQHGSLEATLRAVMEALREWRRGAPLADDVTLVALERLRNSP